MRLRKKERHIGFDKHRFIETFLNIPFAQQDMVRRIGGSRRKTRYKFTKEERRRGKISISRYFQKFKLGDKVALSVEPAVQNGMYNPNYIGKIGTIAGKRGRCYEVLMKDANKEKTLISHPVHLRRV